MQWSLKNHPQLTKRYVNDVCINATLLGISTTISTAAGKLNYERKKAGKKWGMIDSIIAATAQSYGLKILTKDKGFADLAEVEMLD